MGEHEKLEKFSLCAVDPRKKPPNLYDFAL